MTKDTELIKIDNLELEEIIKCMVAGLTSDKHEQGTLAKFVYIKHLRNKALNKNSDADNFREIIKNYNHD